MAPTYLTVKLGSGLRDPGGQQLPAKVRFTPNTRMTNGTVTIGAVERTVGYDGTLDGLVAATTDPGTDPAGGAYLIEVLPRSAEGYSFLKALPHDAPGGIVNLDDLLELVEAPALVSDALAQHMADTTNVHGIPSTAALETTTGSAAKVAAEATLRTAGDAALDARLDTVEAWPVRGDNTVTTGGQVGQVLALAAASPVAFGLQTTRIPLARQVLAAGARPYDASQVHPSPPTLTLSAVNAATSISSGVLVPPARVDSATIDTTNDPHFEHLGIVQGALQVSSGNKCYPALLTGGASQAARHRVRFRFHHNGQALEAAFRQRTTSFTYRVWVDGIPTAATSTTATVTATGTYLLKVDFGSVGSRLVELEVTDPEFGGVYIEPTATLQRSRLRRPTLMGFGDSITAGANGVASTDTWLRHASQILGCDWINTAIGGSGYFASAGNGADFRTRITPDVVSQKPDVLVIFGSYNDTGVATAQQIQDESLYVFQQIRSQLPGTILIVGGCWSPSQAPGSTLLGADAAVKASAAAVGAPFISLIDPLQRSGLAAAWAATTAYNVGDMVVSSGVVWKCITAHTSTSSFDATKWKSTTFLTGTGRVGATAGNGNADVLLGSDATHPTAEGHRALGYFMAQEITRALRVLAA